MTQSPVNLETPWFNVIRLLRWDKPAGRLILMIPALWAIFLAQKGVPPLPLVGVIIVGSLVTSAAGCVINDLWDRDLDPQVERTKNRPLAARALSVKVAIVVALFAMVCAGILALYLNYLSFWLSVLAVPFIIVYPLAKRFFPIPQLVLSLTWGFAVLISWSAVTPSFNLNTWLLWGATVFWTLGFDTVYAMGDRLDDQKIGINSSALFFGKFAPEAIVLFYLLTAIFLGDLALRMEFNFLFWLAWAIACVSWFKQYLQLKQPEIAPPFYGKMFSDNVIIGFILLGGMIFNQLV